MMVAACLTLGACGKSETDVISSAKAHLDKRDVKTATVELKALLQKTPQSGEGRYLLGRALLESGDLTGAEAELNRALENKYSDEIVAPVMAQVLYSQRQYRKLTDRYAKFEVADAQAATTLKVILGLAFAAQGRMTLFDSRLMLALIRRLPEDSQQRLLDLAATGDWTAPACPECGERMVVRNVIRRPFWGCSRFPQCRGTLPMNRKAGLQGDDGPLAMAG